MFKKILVLLLPLSTLVSCNNQPQPEPDPNSPLCITCTKGKTTLEYFFVKGWHDETPPPNLEYSFDKANWKTVEIKDVEEEWPETEGEIDELKQGQTIYLRGDNPDGFNRFGHELNTHVTFDFTNPNENAEIKIGGNVMSLLSKDNYVSLTEIPCAGCFTSLFANIGCPEEENITKGSVDASELSLPATTLKDAAYLSMFGHSALTRAPLELPAIHSNESCYENMFEGSVFLKIAPVIKLEDLSYSACRYMFDNCSNLNITKSNNGTKIFTCPPVTGGFAVYHMFNGTKQGEMEDPVEGEVFYYN